MNTDGVNLMMLVAVNNWIMFLHKLIRQMKMLLNLKFIRECNYKFNDLILIALHNEDFI